MRQPIIEKGVTLRGVLVTAAVIAAASAVALWLDPAPRPTPPSCNPGEVAVPAKKIWYCVLAREP